LELSPPASSGPHRRACGGSCSGLAPWFRKLTGHREPHQPVLGGRNGGHQKLRARCLENPLIPSSKTSRRTWWRDPQRAFFRLSPYSSWFSCLWRE
jgi:hypothetical protein